MRVSLIGLLGLLFSASGLAQSNNSAIFRFLEITPSAQSAAMGGNHPGLYTSNYSLFHINPAYLIHSETGELSASFVNYLADARMGFVSSPLKLNDRHLLGFGLRFMGYGDFRQLDENGNDLGSFNAVDVAFGTSYATVITPQWTIGAGIDLIHSSYESYQSSALALSGGLYYKNPDDEFSLGVAVRNLGTQLSTYDGIREPMPLDVSAGFTKKPEGFPAYLTLTLRRLNDWDMRTVGESERPPFLENALRHVLLGGEADLGEYVSIRLGYNHFLHEQTKTNENFDFAGFAMGIGLSLKDFIIDISRHSYSESGGVVQLSIRTQL